MTNDKFATNSCAGDNRSKANKRKRKREKIKLMKKKKYRRGKTNAMKQ